MLIDIAVVVCIQVYYLLRIVLTVLFPLQLTCPIFSALPGSTIAGIKKKHFELHAQFSAVCIQNV